MSRIIPKRKYYLDAIFYPEIGLWRDIDYDGVWWVYDYSTEFLMYGSPAWRGCFPECIKKWLEEQPLESKFDGIQLKMENELLNEIKS